MAKNHQTENALFKALTKKYEADIAAAYATLVIQDINIHILQMSSQARLIGISNR